MEKKVAVAESLAEVPEPLRPALYGHNFIVFIVFVELLLVPFICKIVGSVTGHTYGGVMPGLGL